nr:hypothetical protein [Tanacetum cinerariifolium]
DESHRINNIHTNNNKGGPSALPNEWTANKYKDQNKKFNRANLVCKHCNRNGHTIVRCFELVGYPQNFKKKDNQSVSSNVAVAVAGSKVDQKPGPSVTHSFTNDRFQKLVALISDKSGSSCVPANIADYHVSLLSMHKLSKNNNLRVSFDEDKHFIQDSVQRTLVGTDSEKGGLYFFETCKFFSNNNIQICCLSKCLWHDRLGHPFNQISGVLKRKINIENWNDVGPYESENKDYEMVSQDTNSLKFFNNFNEETRLDEPYDDNERDRKSRQGEDTNPSSFGATENTGSTKKDEGGHPSTPEEVINEEVDGVTHEDDNMSEGDDFYDDFNKMFQQSVKQSNDFYTPNKQGRNLRRSSRKFVLPAKLQDFKLNTSVKYSIDNQVSYSKLSLENFSFSTSINKIREPKTYDEASSDMRWIEAMNLEMKALNRNGTWLITDLLKEERPMVISGVLKLSTSLVEK